MKGVAAFGWLTAAFGAFASLMVLTNLSTQSASDATIRFLASAALGAAGVVIARRARRGTSKIDAQLAEQEILRVARAHDGRITAAEVAAESAVPLAQAGEMLEALSGKGACRMSVAEAGILVFEFPELQSPAQTDESHASHARAAAAQRTSN